MNSTVNLIATLADPSATRPFQDFKTVFKAGAGLYTILTEQTVLCNIATSACHEGGWAYVLYYNEFYKFVTKTI